MTLKDQLNETVSFIKKRSNSSPLIGIILGSGWGGFAKTIKVECSIPYSEIPHFAPPTVEGHGGNMIFGSVKDAQVCVLQGRIHYFEGHSMEQVAYPTRVLASIGIKALLLTNAAGGLNPKMKPGDFMVIQDHINLFGDNPLKGKRSLDVGTRFPDMTKAYDPELTEVLCQTLTKKKIRFTKGVYAGLSGPAFETPAEIKYLQTIGATAAGMSTVPETIAAHHMGVRVSGLSCITNLGAGMTGEKITHEEVGAVARAVEKQFCDFLADAVVEYQTILK